jgi:uncharacterized hydrophobic protein (TIGR00271 family)
MLELRVHGDRAAMAGVADRIADLPGVRHLAVTDGWRSGETSVAADIAADRADHVLRVLVDLGVPPGDIALVHLDRLGSTPDPSDSLGVVWADVLGQAQARAQTPARYVVLMAAAGVVATFAVTERSPVLLVGAMAISPDLLPITAACTGLVLRRWRLALRGIVALVVGLAVAGVVAAVVTVALDAFSLLPDGFTLGAIPAGQDHVNTGTILIGLAAGVAGMLSVESRGSSAVGVAISVTTIPASAYLGVGIGLGELGKALPALGVLSVNVVMMLLGGWSALAVQRRRSREHELAVTPRAS